jgi:hypothetical protein
MWIPALVFTSLLIAFFLTAFFVVPKMSPDQRDISYRLFALLSGFATFFLGGSALFTINAPASDRLKVGFSATAGVAVFAFVYTRPPYWFVKQGSGDKPPPASSSVGTQNASATILSLGPLDPRVGYGRRDDSNTFIYTRARYELHVKVLVDNPSERPIALKDLSVRLFKDGRTIAQGTGDPTGPERTIGAMQSRVLELTVPISSDDPKLLPDHVETELEQYPIELSTDRTECVVPYIAGNGDEERQLTAIVGPKLLRAFLTHD